MKQSGWIRLKHYFSFHGACCLQHFFSISALYHALNYILSSRSLSLLTVCPFHVTPLSLIWPPLFTWLDPAMCPCIPHPKNDFNLNYADTLILIYKVKSWPSTYELSCFSSFSCTHSHTGASKFNQSFNMQPPGWVLPSETPRQL